MDEATALLLTLEATPPHAPTACADWTAHDLVAHLAAGAAEMAALIQAALAGQPERPTAGFEEREAPFAALDDAVLRQRLVAEALRLNAAVEALDRAGDGCTVAFAGRQLDPAALSLHGRSEAALHRWDLVGDDEVGRELLGQAELTAHALTVLNAMEVAEGVTTRAAFAGVEDRRLTFASPGQPDVVLVADGAGTRLELDEPSDSPTATADAATRLLALWGRRSQTGPVHWGGDDPACRQLTTFCWGSAPR